MAQNRASLETQEEVIADVLRDKYLSYYRDMYTKLITPATVKPSVVPAAVVNKATVNYSNIIPGKTLVVNYDLSGAEEGASHSPAPVLLLGGLALAACFLAKKR